jgi:hypothetical protein
VGVGRELQRAPQRQFVLGECGIAVVHQAQQQRMRRMVRLQVHHARLVGAPGPARDLHDQLRDPLGGAEIRAEQRLVDADHRHDREVRQVVTLGQHLRPHQDAGLVLGDAVEQRAQGLLAARRVAVDPQHRHVGKPFLQSGLDPLRARAERDQLGAATFGARCRRRALRAAVVAAQLVARAVERERAVAAPAARGPAAVVADQQRGVTAPVAEHQRLLAARHRGRDRIDQRRAEPVLDAQPARVEDLDGRRARIARARR